MAINDFGNTPHVEQNIEETKQPVPVGIARIRDEWREAGLVEDTSAPPKEEEEPVVFTEVDGGAGIGDYTLDGEKVRSQLALSDEAFGRLISSGELDSLLVQGADGQTRRLFSESSVNRFRTDSAIDPNAIRHAAKAMADASVTEAIQEIQAVLEEVRDTQGKVLQQMKDMLLLELRNLKEQDRDLTSFVYELAEEIRAQLPKKKR
ncbi:MAG: hypothetical protein NT018_00890 [Armatimonadetes bacterium]|nr:hypothetical protein [Armatimonadota bacterium]